jgi:uncharacterized membrane protein
MTPILSKETVGTFIDAIYAIAVTILALEVPGEFESGFGITSFGEMLVEYALSFLILFALWVQHRRINALNEDQVGTTVIWINCFVLLMVCLVPRATTLVFNYGGDVTLAQLEASMNHGAGWTLSEFVDTFYVFLVIAADVGLLMLVGRITRNSAADDKVRLRRSKITVTVLTVGVLLLSLLIPLQNRYFLLLIPLSLMFERRLGMLIFRGSG